VRLTKRPREMPSQPQRSLMRRTFPLEPCVRPSGQVRVSFRRLTGGGVEQQLARSEDWREAGSAGTACGAGFRDNRVRTLGKIRGSRTGKKVVQPGELEERQEALRVWWEREVEEVR